MVAPGDWMHMPHTQEGLARLIDRERLADGRIAAAFRTVDRADFVPDRFRGQAYRDRPVGIPEDQTTSQPSLIARMIDVTGPAPDDRALEIGTGYGFQTALLAQLVDHVTTIERWASLADAARGNLERAGIVNVDVIVGDGWLGHEANSPYDVVIVSAAADEVPRPIVEQMNDGARLVVPIREPGGDNVYLFSKEGGALKLLRLVTPARFVPLIHGSER
jgi:protein-L-isoaspartate(D-aspartate) O-methyltransferase